MTLEEMRDLVQDAIETAAEQGAIPLIPEADEGRMHWTDQEKIHLGVVLEEEFGHFRFPVPEGDSAVLLATHPTVSVSLYLLPSTGVGEAGELVISPPEFMDNI